jgi:hypothetical protein
MVNPNQSIWPPKFFSRVRARTRSISLTICFVFSAFHAIAADPAMLRGPKGVIRGLDLDTRIESKTRGAMKILPNCIRAKNQATALPMVGQETATLVPHVKAHVGVAILEGILADGRFKTLDTQLLGAYMNYPGEMNAADPKSKAKYPLAITLSAPFTSQGDLVFQPGDYLGLKTNGQLYAYKLPNLTIKNGAMLRLFVATDDTLYYDAALTHPLHEGKCKKPTK